MKPFWMTLGAILGALVGLVVLASGCSHLPKAKEACTDEATMKLARKMVVPRLAATMVCAVEAESDDAIMACVDKEFAVLKTEAEPLVWQCGLALVSDVVERGK